MRVFIPINIPNRTELAISKNLINKMKSLGAMILYVDMNDLNIPINLISFIIVEEKEIDYFIIRGAKHRLSDCDVKEFNHFMLSNKSAHFHKQDDDKDQRFLLEMWEGNLKKLRLKFDINRSWTKKFIQVNH